MIYMAILLGISSIMKERNYNVINKQVGLLMGFTTILSFKSMTEFLSFANFSMPLIVLAYQPLVIGILFTAARIKGRKQPQVAALPRDSGNSNTAPAEHVTKTTARFSYKQWVWFSNILMVVSTACIVIGLAFGKYKPIMSIACAMCFACCLFLSLVSTYMEVNLSKQQKPVND